MINSYLNRSVAPIANMTMRTDKTTPRAITSPSGTLCLVELGVTSTEGLDFAVVTVVEVNYKEIKKTIYLEKINYSNCLRLQAVAPKQHKVWKMK